MKLREGEFVPLCLARSVSGILSQTVTLVLIANPAAYFDPTSESRIERAQRVKEDGAEESPNGDAPKQNGADVPA